MGFHAPILGPTQAATTAAARARLRSIALRIRGQTGRFLLSCPRMARPPRIAAINTPHHVTQRGNTPKFTLAERDRKRETGPVCPRFSDEAFGTPTFPAPSVWGLAGFGAGTATY